MQNKLGFFNLTAHVLQDFLNIKNPRRLLSSLQLPWFILTSSDTPTCRWLLAILGRDWGSGNSPVMFLEEVLESGHRSGVVVGNVFCEKTSRGNRN